MGVDPLKNVVYKQNLITNIKGGLIVMVITNCFKLIKSKESGHLNYAQFELKGLTPGEGVTIGNLIRRVLLSDLEGMAISSVRIGGKSKHPFSSIEGIREDTLEILLNLKGIIVKRKNDETKDSYGRLRVQGPSVITADLIELPDEIEIVNRSHYIATVTTSITFEMEFQFKSGVGYKLASGKKLSVEGVKGDALPKDYIDVDCIYTPIRKVNFEIENVYHEDKPLSEKLILDICTDGSIEPVHALKKSCEIIRDVFNSLIKVEENVKSNTLSSSAIARLTEATKDPSNSLIKIIYSSDGFGLDESQETAVNTSKQKESVEQYRNIPIEELDLSVRPYNCLKKENINTLGELLKYTRAQLQKIRNFGRKSGDEVSLKLKEKFNIQLKEDKDT